MPMDEMLRAIEQTDTENIRDLLDAVAARYRQLFPKRALIIMALPVDDRDERRRQFNLACEELQKYELDV